MIKGGNVGKLDTQIIIEVGTVSKDSLTNEENITWATFATVWAEKLRMPASNEQIEAAQQVAIKTGRWKIRHLDGVLETMRVNRDSEISYISGIEELDRKKFLILTVEKRDNDGG